METDLLYSEKKDTLEIKIKKINEKYSAFYATYCTFQNGFSVEKVSEGIQTPEKLNLAIERCFLPEAIEEFIYKDAEFLELVRVYGHPYTLSEDCTYNKFNPYSKIYDLILSLQVKFDDVDDLIFDKLIFIRNASHTIIDMKDNKLVNTAIHSDSLLFNSLHFNNYKDHVNRLILDNKIKIRDSFRSDIFKRSISEGYYYIDAKINFTDEEFYLILSNIESLSDCESLHTSIDYNRFYYALNKFDVLKISSDNEEFLKKLQL